jgi:hypothetical protein
MTDAAIKVARSWKRDTYTRYTRVDPQRAAVMAMRRYHTHK